MYGASRAFAVGGEVEMCGRKLRLRPLIFRYCGMIEERILSQRDDFLGAAIAMAGLIKDDDELRKIVVGSAIERASKVRFATYRDHTEFLETPDGMAYALWLMAHEANDNPPTEDEVRDWLAGELDAALARRLDTSTTLGEAHDAALREVLGALRATIAEASGEGPMGNSTGSPRSSSSGPASRREMKSAGAGS